MKAPDGWECILTYMTRQDADVPRAALEGHGIAVHIDADDCGGMRAVLGIGLLSSQAPVRLFVRTEDAAAALELLGET
jgi:hypothetical protein